MFENALSSVVVLASLRIYNNWKYFSLKSKDLTRICTGAEHLVDSVLVEKEKINEEKGVNDKTSTL